MNKSSVTTIRQVLDRLARVASKSNDTIEIVYDRELARIRNLDRENILEAISEAIGDDSKRRIHAPHVYSELTDVPGIEKIFADLLDSSDANGRSAIIQTIRLHNIRSLVEVLNRHFVKESDDFCRDQLLDTLGALADESSLPIFEYLMRKTDRRDERRILLAAKNYVRPEFKDYLSNVFESDSSEKSHRIFAAWGLAKLGNCEAYEYLVMMLDDPEKTIKAEGTITYDPGQSVRAAQAISDINGWNFTWGKSSVDLIRVRLSSA